MYLLNGGAGVEIHGDCTSQAVGSDSDYLGGFSLHSARECDLTDGICRRMCHFSWQVQPSGPAQAVNIEKGLVQADNDPFGVCPALAELAKVGNGEDRQRHGRVKLLNGGFERIGRILRVRAIITQSLPSKTPTRSVSEDPRLPRLRFGLV